MRTKMRVDDGAMLTRILGPESPVELKKRVTPHRQILKPDLALWAIQLLVRRWGGSYLGYCEAGLELHHHMAEMC